MEPVSDFLFAEPSFLEGVARLFDFGNTLNEYNVSPDGDAADKIALYMDFAMVGSAICQAVEMSPDQVRESTAA